VELKGVAAIVTGGASGLGGGTADMLAAAGAKVAIFDVNEQLGQEKASAIGGKFFKVDVSNEESVLKGIADAEAAHGIARVCVNCAGIVQAAKVLDREGKPLPLADFSRIINVNLIGTFNVLSKFAARAVTAEPLNSDGERGVIINTASVAAIEGQIGQPAYAASKGGVAALALPVAREFARSGIRVMTIAPGIFWTPMMESLPKEAQESLGKMVPFPSRLGTVQEYAALVQHIITNPMLNGELIRLDGAIRMAAK
jgi:NAD(P)-dependent dehydrogenase (short-subunit alcohol dehydrogenase family)